MPLCLMRCRPNAVCCALAVLAACGGSDRQHASEVAPPDADDSQGDTGPGEQLSPAGPSMTLVSPVADAVVKAGEPLVLDLTAVLTNAATDPNGDAVTLHCQWFVDGADAHLATATAPATRTAKGEHWKVIVVASDPGGQTATASAEVVIGNAPPTCDQAIFLPSEGDTRTTLTCACSDRHCFGSPSS